MNKNAHSKQQKQSSQIHEVKILKIIPHPKQWTFIDQTRKSQHTVSIIIQDNPLDDFSFGLNSDKHPLYERIRQDKCLQKTPEKLNFITSPTCDYELMDFGYSEYVPSFDDGY